MLAGSRRTTAVGSGPGEGTGGRPVLSLPHPVRFLMVRDAELLKLVRGIFVRAVQSFYVRRASAEGHPAGRTGVVVCVQRFDSALRLDLQEQCRSLSSP